MNKLLRLVLCAYFILGLSNYVGAQPTDGCPAAYEKLLDMVHTQWGSNETNSKILSSAQDLSKSYPKTGCSQVILAEIISTWLVNTDGNPREQRITGLHLADEALGLNPRLAQAHVSKARLLIKSADIPRATDEIEAALKINSRLAGALFIKAELLRRTSQFEESEKWFLQFIGATPSSDRKANGYFAIGDMWDDLAWASRSDPHTKKMLLDRAKPAMRKYVELRSSSIRANLNYAAFLNALPEDYEGAERHAKKALELGDGFRARYYWAAALYQRLLSKSAGMNEVEIINASNDIFKLTTVSLDEALSVGVFSAYVAVNLERLRSKIKSKELPWLETAPPKPSGTIL